MSYITLHMDDWQTRNYVACCGTAFAPVEQMLRTYPQIRQVHLCLDNDEAGHNASERMEGYLCAEGISEVAPPYTVSIKIRVICQKKSTTDRWCFSFGGFNRL